MSWYRWKIWRLAWSWNRGEVIDNYGLWRSVVGNVWILTHRRPKYQQDKTQ